MRGKAALRLVVMGPSGCGKTTLARALAESLGCRFVEGDDLHPASNVQKMRTGLSLGDGDREPWLRAVAAELSRDPSARVVVACSALKHRYRDLLRAEGGLVHFVLPSVARDVLAGRLAGRTGHFMPPSLLDSQLADLEPLSAEEAGWMVDGTAPLSRQIEQVQELLAKAGINCEVC